MKITDTAIPGVKIIEPKTFGDHRGMFYESYNQKIFEEAGIVTNWIQDNHSVSKHKILRGLHFQRNTPQTKLVSVTQGAVWDVVVDLRRNSGSYLCCFGLELNEDNRKILYVPAGFAHGFCVLSENAHFQYKVDAPYSPKDEDGLLWNDPNIEVAWPFEDPILNDRDRMWKRLEESGSIYCE